MKIATIGGLVVICFIISSCALIHLFDETNVRLLWKYKFEPGIISAVQPRYFAYDKEEEILYTRGDDELVAAIDLNRKEVVWDKRIRTFLNLGADIEICGDKVYIIRMETEESSSAVMALDKWTGEVEWEYRLQGKRPETGLAQGEGYLYVLDHVGYREGALIKLDKDTGEKIWETKGLKAFIYTEPVIDEERGLIYVTSRDYDDDDYNPTFYAIDKETGKVVWKYEIESKHRDDFATVPVIYGDSVYAATWFGLVVRLKRDTGEVVWKRRYFPDDSSVHPVNWGFGNRLQIYDDKLILMRPAGYIYALNTENGDVVWKAWTRYSADDVYLDKESGRIYVHNWGPEIRCYSAEDGKLIWMYEYEGGEGRVGGAPYKVGKYIFDGDTGGNFYILEELR
ncbi:PQQ-binding-like beta-propeller repeat protein [Kosmotoga olearia]|uniref:Pyrrolo-quinoline quinone n=1 Tax=Kosmotoga olearia (strain ATCC BAA-1733 / DSM 21960 / TBF 19.5.1) TaxID=521045 RepID=C5CHK9_KOSOT|nr:PQQ-binding-like beta-propeller repeat protein [Kosmotoga olearia]ACR79764.1 Pyrrolo-quinoline quinone [Kosmotoga olearia TBF 19.5.1]